MLCGQTPLSFTNSIMVVPSLPPSREELKQARIAVVLQASITSTLALRTLQGHVTYFEHEFTNTHSHPLTVSVSWRDPNLK